MPFQRPRLPVHASGSFSKNSTTSENSQTPSKRRKLSGLSQLKVYIVQAKLDSPEIAELFRLTEKYCDKACGDPEEADVIITAIEMRKRLERHVPWDVARVATHLLGRGSLCSFYRASHVPGPPTDDLSQRTKAVVLPDWLRNSIQEGKALSYGAYVAVEELQPENFAECPTSHSIPCNGPSPNQGETQGTLLGLIRPPQTEELASGRKHTQQDHSALGSFHPIIPSHLLNPKPPVPTDESRLSYASRYACQRASPLICPNQALAVELDIIRRSRALEGEERSALSYARAISAIKAYPHLITSRAQASQLPYIGTKIINLVEEFVDSRRISEARQIADSPRFRALSLFSSIYGIGPHTARRLHALGLETLEHLEIYYGADCNEVLQGGQAEIDNEVGEDQEEEGKVLEEIERPQQQKWWPGKGREKHLKGKKLGGRSVMPGDNGEDLGESWIKVALGLREDLAMKIPRDEVEEMNRVVMRELGEIEPGCTSMIVGGYRRGKLESNDVDIVFTHPDGSKVKGLCKRLVRQLHERGMVSHVMHLSSFHGHNSLRTNQWDSLEKALTVFILPPSSPFYREHKGHGLRRRLDLIFAKPEVYWCTVVGWSGSVMFERDLRKWAKDKRKMKFDSSGITRRYDSKEFYPKTENEVFEVFGLEWVDPTLRNADV